MADRAENSEPALVSPTAGDKTGARTADVVLDGPVASSTDADARAGGAPADPPPGVSTASLPGGPRLPPAHEVTAAMREARAAKAAAAAAAEAAEKDGGGAEADPAADATAQDAAGEEPPPVPEVPSPFSDVMGPYKLSVDMFRWRRLEDGPSKGCWMRGMWGGEMYQERRSAGTGRADDMLTTTVLALPPTLAASTFVELFKLAVMQMRFEYPITGVTIESGHIAIPLLPCAMYKEIESYADLEEWISRSVVTVTPSTPEERALSFHDFVEQTRNKVGLQALDVATCARTTYVVLPTHPEDAHEIAIMVYCAHAISDAHTELLLVRKELAYIAKLLDAPSPLPHTHPLHPASNALGTESARLPPVLHELLGVDIDSFDVEKGYQLASKVYCGHALRLDQGREPGEGLCPTHHTTVVLSTDESAAVQAAARAEGWTVTQVADAARHMACMEMRREYVEAEHEEPIPETVHINFLMPIDARSRIVQLDAERGFVGNATAGFTTVLPLGDPHYVPAETELQQDPSRALADLSQVRVLEDIAEKLAAQYRDNVAQFYDLIEGITPVLMVGGTMNPDYPPPALAPEGFSSVGVVERVLPVEHQMPHHAEPVRVRDWGVGLVMSRHLFSLQFSVHLWSLGGRIHLSVVHTDHFSQEYTMHFLNTIRDTLLLFARASQDRGGARRPRAEEGAAREEGAVGAVRAEDAQRA
ncbi:hypothetical protein MSPP1_001168 [Malassezia sp. CBS 17886]|nr:hypothetical protein MSPP1_001168 [Malassezia sp. CBS 17886]